MQQRSEGETPEELVKVAAEIHYKLTLHKLHRWQQAGLIPAPQQIPLGYGLGTTTRYPIGTKAQLLATVKFLKQYRRIPVALWLLWWNGFRVSEDKIRELLQMELRELFRTREAIITNSRDEERYFRSERKAAKRRLPHPLLATMRRRTGKKDFSFFLMTMRGIGTGVFDEWNQEEEPMVLAKGLSLKDEPKELKKNVLQASQLLDPRELQKALETSGTEELQNARRELRELLKLLENCAVVLDQLLGTKISVPLFNQPLRLPFGMWLQAVLVWRSLSASTEFRKGYESFISNLAAGDKIRVALDEHSSD